MLFSFIQGKSPASLTEIGTSCVPCHWKPRDPLQEVFSTQWNINQRGLIPLSLKLCLDARVLVVSKKKRKKTKSCAVELLWSVVFIVRLFLKGVTPFFSIVLRVTCLKRKAPLIQCLQHLAETKAVPYLFPSNVVLKVLWFRSGSFEWKVCKLSCSCSYHFYTLMSDQKTALHLFFTVY